METLELRGNGQIREGRTVIDVPHLGETLTFVLPLIGPNYHEKVMGEVNRQKLLRPTTAQTLSLVDLAFQNKGNGHCAGILKKFTNNYLWTATESISSPRGVIVYDNVDGQMPQTSSELMELVKAGDPRARFVQKGFKTGDMNLSEFLKHPYTIAQVGEDMLPVLERVAKQVNEKRAWVYGLNSSKSGVKRYTAVGDYYGRLGLVGFYYCDGREGFASGVLKTGEASRAKN